MYEKENHLKLVHKHERVKSDLFLKRLKFIIEYLRSKKSLNLILYVILETTNLNLENILQVIYFNSRTKV